MNLDQLIAFERIAREGSFSRAAWALQIAQPTISARIQALEDEVGGALFKRSSHRVALTEYGAGFLPYARRAIAALSEGLEVAQRTQQGEQGRISLGVLRSMTGGFLSPALADYNQTYPQIACYIPEGDHWQIVEWLHEGVIELGLIAWPCVDPVPTALQPLLLFHEPVVLLAAKHHPLARLQTVTEADIIRLSNPFLLMRWWQVTPAPLTRLAAQANSVVDVPMDTGRYLLAQGQGAGFFNRSQIEAGVALRDVVALPVSDLPRIYRDSALVSLARNTELSPAMQNFVASIKRQGERLGLLA